MSTQEGPTLGSEFRRGLNLYNLMVGLLTGLVIGLLTYGTMFFEFLPDLYGKGKVIQSCLTGIFIFILTTWLHTITHSYFGWRFEKGIKASTTGQHLKAVRLLGLAEKQKWKHYDIEGFAFKALQSSRKALQKENK